MKKVVLMMLMALTIAFGGYAAGSPLQQAYEKVCKQSIGRAVPPEHIAQLIWELQSKLYMKTAEVRMVGPGLSIQQLQQDWNAVREITDKIPAQMLKICAFNNFNNFSFYVSDDSNDGLKEVLIIWMTAFDGDMTIWYGTMTEEMIQQIEFGDLDMSYQGVKISPMKKPLVRLLTE